MDVTTRAATVGSIEKALARTVPGWGTGIPTMDRVLAPVPTVADGRRPRFSVITPCYNYARFLPVSVQSSLDQPGVDVEVIVVNDASTDDSLAVAQSLAADDPRVRIVNHRRNTGHVVAFNDGYAVATGEFIVRVDADDLLTKGSLARSAAVFESFPSVGLVYGHPRHFTREVPTQARTQVDGWTIWPGRDWLAARCRQGVNCITTPEAVVRADVMHSVGPLRPELSFAQDMEMWLRAAAASDVGRVDGPDQALHRDHEDSMTATTCYGVLTDLRERRHVFEVFFNDPAAPLPGAEVLRETAMRTLAGEALDRACRAYDRGRVDVEPVDEYVDFALETYPRATNLSQWSALRRRHRVGARLSPWVPPFFARAVQRRINEELWYARWARTGV